MTLVLGGRPGAGAGTLRGVPGGVLLPRGIPVPFWHAGPLLVSVALPMVAQVFAVVTVLGRLRRIDPVQIIERRG
jgi:hypothetical protein